MKQVAIIGCGAYMDSGYGCPGEWRCLKSAAMGEGKFDEPMSVISFLKCQCPGRSTAANLGLSFKMGETKPEVIHLSSCMAGAKPGCPYASAEEMAEIITANTGVPVILGTHDYH